MLKQEISRYLHKSFVHKTNRSQFTKALSYYNDFYFKIKNYKLERQFGDLELSQIRNNLINGCRFIVTSDTNSDNKLISPECYDIDNYIYNRVNLYQHSKKNKKRDTTRGV